MIRSSHREAAIGVGRWAGRISLWLGLGLAGWVGAAEPCRIEVVDKSCGWPVPMVELRTLHGARFVTDNAGLIAFDLPELMGRETWFDVIGQGYEVKKDGFGYAGVRLTPEPGGRHRIEVDRTIIARRLGRITGGGLFGESQKLGEDVLAGIRRPRLRFRAKRPL